ncbi:MAG: iron dependent repressor, metal binding and dimerization domain protein [Anaerolineaceae bacterium]|nr:iron dependent repressor, metal binding and dimerization domain protein [Anaerolineaceae bacterium]
MQYSTSFILYFLLLAVLAALVFWPRRGLLARWQAWKLASQRQQIEDALKYMVNAAQEGRSVHRDTLAGALHLSERSILQLVGQLQSQGLVENCDCDVTLTSEGRHWALQVVRAHRLWERYLADEARMPLEQIHSIAHQREHGMTLAQIDALDASLGHPASDPHGDPIPSAGGALRHRPQDTTQSVPLTAWVDGQRGKIVHLEDEPTVAYAQLLAIGLHVGQVVSVLENGPEKYVLTDGENEYVIAAPIAANVYLQVISREEAIPEEAIPLSALPDRAKAEIVLLDERCQGFTRRRFLDLGLTPGTTIFPELENAFREPRAYRVRGTLIALRNDQAAMIWVHPTQNDGARSYDPVQ